VYWRRRLDRAPGAGPLLRDDRVLVAEQGQDGRVRALRLSDGRELWSRTGGDVTAPLAMNRAELYAGSLDGRVTKLSAHDGSVLWRTRVSGGVRAAPLPAGGLVIVATVSDSMFALDDSGGAVRRRRPTLGTVLAAPALAGSVIVFGTSAGRLEAADAASLMPLWTLDLPDPIVGSVAVRGNTAYAVTARGLLVAVSLEGPGAGSRRVEVGLVARAGPMPVPGGVFVSGLNGEILWLGPALERRWSARVEAPVVEPVLVDGRTLLVVSQRGDVVAFR
jgi:outer membrane protein assembly factor BamB